MKRLYIFLALTFLLTWTGAFVLMNAGGNSNPIVITAFMLFMFIPAISVLITRKITKEGFNDMWIKPNIKGNVKYYLMAWFLPPILITLGAIIYFLIFPSKFDPNMNEMVKLYNQKDVSLSTDIPIILQFIPQILIAILLAPILNLAPTLGEELGWRGYLLPKLCERYSNVVAVLISGIIWGVWHAPMIAMGHNYGLGYPSAPFGGIAAMIVFCIFTGAFLSYLALKVRSAMPAAVAHGALNGFAAAGLFFVVGESNPFVGPLPTGIIGGIGFIITGIICFLLVRREITVQN